MHDVKLYFRYIRINMLSQMQYKGWVLSIVRAFIVVLSDPVDAVLLVLRFGMGSVLAGRVLLVYGMAVCSFALTELFVRGFDYFPTLVKQGAFDRLLLRPRGTVLQVMALRFDVSRFSRFFGMLALIFISIGLEGTWPGFTGWIVLLSGLMGGFLMYAGVFILQSALSIYLKESTEIYIFTNASYQVNKAPPEMMPDWLRRMYLYVLPVLVVSYYPANTALGWGGPAWAGWLSLPAGTAFLTVALVFWHYSVKKYQGAGS